MCSPATCGECGKATYSGCGSHVDYALAGVPEDERCTCANGKPKPSLGGWTFYR
jgi:hypothetical protein